MKPILNSGARPKMGDRPRRPLILYVEDEESNQQVAMMRLGRSFELLMAQTDRAACAIAREYGNKLYAILMDIELKGSLLNGIELTMLFRNRLPAQQVPSFAAELPPLDLVPIIFVSAYGGRYREEELVKVGGSRLIAKPVNFLELTKTMTLYHLDRARSVL